MEKQEYIVDFVISEKAYVFASSSEEAEKLVKNHLFVASGYEGEVSPDGRNEIRIENIAED
tara:strand:- start:494 stop:676 length:183 start_codon:yes stop_codon:yes gene_type:complete